MNKKDYVAVIATKTQMPKNEVEAIIDASHEVIVESLHKGEDIKLSGFGTFYSLKRTSRQGRNPKTGETVKIPEKTVIKFKAGKVLKELINE